MIQNQQTVKTTIEIDSDLFYAAKMKALQGKKTFKMYITQLITADVEEKPISKSAKIRYDKIAEEIEKGVGNVKVKDVDDLMQKLEE